MRSGHAVEALIVVFVAVNHYFVGISVFTLGEAVYYIDGDLAVLFVVEGALLEGPDVRGGHYDVPVFCEAVPVELLDFTAVKHRFFISDELTDLKGLLV